MNQADSNTKRASRECPRDELRGLQWDQAGPVGAIVRRRREELTLELAGWWREQWLRACTLEHSWTRARVRRAAEHYARALEHVLVLSGVRR